MPNPDNVNPHQYKKGQSGNPAGRPKGALGTKSILRKYFEANIEAKDPVTGEMKKMPVMEVLQIAQITEAMKGNTKAYMALMDRFEGRVNQRIELETPNGPLKVETTANQIDWSQVPEDALDAIIAASKPPKDESTTKAVKPARKNGAKGKGTRNKK